jgi:hypothetical protein
MKEESIDRNKHLDNIVALNNVVLFLTKQMIPDFEKRLKQASNQREDSDKAITNEINQAFEELAGGLQQERKKRDENDQSSFDIIKEFVENARKEINNEKREREKSEESFLSLMEDTCSKLQALAKI